MGPSTNRYWLLALLVLAALATPAFAASAAIAPQGEVAGGAATEPAAAPPAVSAADAQHRAEQAEFFHGPIVTIALTLKPSAVETLRESPRSYVQGVMKSGKETWNGVAVKLKGASGSFQPIDAKPCFTLKLDPHGESHRFHGLRKFHLNNAREDPSFLRQQLCGEMVRAAGIPALRCTHALVSLNGDDLGLYVLTEAYTEDLLAPFFADPSGDLYEGAFCCDIDQGLTKDTGDPADVSAIEELRAACREDDPAQRWTKLAAILDVDHYATFLSLETLLCIWDGYDFYVNNYRIYHDPGTRRLTFIPHGMDQPFSRIEFDLRATPRSIVGRAFTSCKEGRALDRARVAELQRDLLASRDWPAEVAAASAKVLAAVGRHEGVNAARLRLEQDALRDLVARRIAFTGKAIAGMQAPLRFDDAGIARPTAGWMAQPEESATFDRVGDKGLRIVAAGECQGSWRCPVTLAAGHYRFEAKVKTAGVKGIGAGLRISGNEAEGEWIAGNHANHAIACEFDVPDGGGDVVLIAELRAAKGEAVFSLGSFRLLRSNERPPQR